MKAVVTSGSGPSGLMTTHLYKVGELIELEGTGETLSGRAIYFFVDARGLEQTLFRNQFEWLSEVLQ